MPVKLHYVPNHAVVPCKRCGQLCTWMTSKTTGTRYLTEVHKPQGGGYQRRTSGNYSNWTKPHDCVAERQKWLDDHLYTLSHQTPTLNQLWPIEQREEFDTPEKWLNHSFKARYRAWRHSHPGADEAAKDEAADLIDAATMSNIQHANNLLATQIEVDRLRAWIAEALAK